MTSAINTRRVFRGMPAPCDRPPLALAIGNFDGVHRGHQALIARTVTAARDQGLTPAVLTFEPHPRELFGTAPDRIQPLRTRIETLLSYGVERVHVLAFTHAFAALSPEAFVRDVLMTGLNARWLTTSTNFFFGAMNAGDSSLLAHLAPYCGFIYVPTPLENHGTDPVSSSRVREALAAGDLTLARRLLGHSVTVSGRVRHGAALGRTIGFPTLNLALTAPGSRARPAVRGVYAVRIHGLEDGPLGGVACLGCKPTVTSAGVWLLETHVFDWKGNAYGRPVTVELVEKLRDEKKFSGLSELQAAIALDEARARALLASQDA